MIHNYNNNSSDQRSNIPSGGWFLIGQTPILHVVTEVTLIYESLGPTAVS